MARYREENHPAPPSSHFAWMREAGFHEIDVVWKYYNFAVWTGRK
jgi:tRNA (cmo5U34)-methyltransferase